MSCSQVIDAFMYLLKTNLSLSVDRSYTNWLHAPGVMFQQSPSPSTFLLQQRYYGKSLPFGSASFTGDNIGYLSVEQALADYAVLLTQLKQEYKIDKVVAFGGRWTPHCRRLHAINIDMWAIL